MSDSKKSFVEPSYSVNAIHAANLVAASNWHTSTLDIPSVEQFANEEE